MAIRARRPALRARLRCIPDRRRNLRGMDPQQYLDHLARDSDLLADAAAAAGPDAPVPTLPGVERRRPGPALRRRRPLGAHHRRDRQPRGCAARECRRTHRPARPSSRTSGPARRRWCRRSRPRSRNVGVDVLAGRPHRAVLVPAPGAGDGGPPLRRPGGRRVRRPRSTLTLAVDGADEFLTVFLGATQPVSAMPIGEGHHPFPLHRRRR